MTSHNSAVVMKTPSWMWHIAIVIVIVIVIVIPIFWGDFHAGQNSIPTSPIRLLFVAVVLSGLWLSPHGIREANECKRAIGKRSHSLTLVKVTLNLPNHPKSGCEPL